MKKLIVCLFVLASALIFSQEKKEVLILTPDYSSCIKSYDAGWQSTGQRAVRFYNGCPTDLYMRACIITNMGEAKFYDSGQPVPSYGHYTLYAPPFSDAKKIRWSASTSGQFDNFLCEKK